MVGRFEVFGRMSILRTVAAADMSARETHPQRYPAVPCYETVFTHRHVFRGHLTDLILMMAFSLCHMGTSITKHPAIRGVLL